MTIRQDLISSATKVFMIDLFCGAGGTATGGHLAGIELAACINHDPVAIRSHARNYPKCIHYNEDIKSFDVEHLRLLVAKLRRENPGCLILLWASLECTNFSKAKGGLSRDPDSRSLADDMPRYLLATRPDMFYVENVSEFLEWGPMRWKCEKMHEDRCDLKFSKDKKTKQDIPFWEPIKELKRMFYDQWVQDITKIGNYKYEYRLLNAADFRAFTSRKRLFIQFVKPELNIVWPEATHAKFPEKHPGMLRWKAVKHCLDFSDEGESIFTRKKPLSNNTLERIYGGLVKYVAGGKDSFLTKYYSGKPMYKSIPTDGPAGAITTVDGHSLVNAKFLALNYSGGGQLASIDGPSPTVSTKDRISVVNPVWIDKGFSGPENHQSVEVPSGAVPTKAHYSVVSPTWLDKTYGNSRNHQSVDAPAGTVMVNDKHQLVQAFMMLNYSQGKTNESIDNPCGSLLTVPKENLISLDPWVMNTNFSNIGSSVDEPANTITANRKWSYLMNPQYNNKGGSIENPCFTLIARMDKMPPYLVDVESAQGVILVYESDSPAMVKIKEFMAIYGLCDIKMRMLRVKELLKIQGFPEGYVLEGTQTDQKKFIGNSVEVNCCQALLSVRVDNSNFNEKAA